MSAVSVDWATCSEDACIGVPANGRDKCLTHLAPHELDNALDQFKGGEVDARGVTLTRPLVDRLLRMLPQTRDGRPRFARADFSKATFKGYVGFLDVAFEGAATFDGAIFDGDAGFDRAIFGETASFQDVTFSGYAYFKSATFTDSVVFRRTTFIGYAMFENTTFKRDVTFGYGVEALSAHLKQTTFNDSANFNETTFEGDAGFGGVVFIRSASFRRSRFAGDMDCWRTTFESNVWFEEAVFNRNGSFKEATFCNDAAFGGASFETARNFGPLLALATLSLDNVKFEENLDLAVSANRFSLSRARFMAGVNASVRWAEIVLDEAHFGAASILSGSPQPSEDSAYSTFAFIKEEALIRLLTDAIREGRRSDRPSVLSMRRTIVGDLLLSDVDLRRCRFTRARNLDGLRLEGDVSFARSPGKRTLPRQVLAEERQWRAERGSHAQSSPWRLEEDQLPAWFRKENPEVDGVLDTYLISALYRDLRKGREANKDEPGAADFYYGEMEMRRLDMAKPRAERLILWLYWLVSGYGLRASRSLMALLITVLVFAVLLFFWGFPSQRPFLDSLTFSAESTTSLFRAPERELTLAGEWLQIGLRLLGPLFFGLALLSLRGRVKR